MADTAPTTNGGSNITIDSLKDNAQAAINTVANGPVAQNVKEQTGKTTDEFSNLANARQRPSQPAATGQPLTHYHSFFSELLSWRNPRASGIAYAAVVSLIFAFRYLDILRYGFKLTYLALGVTVAAEVAGKLVLNNGLATQFRPRKYYTVPRETLDALIGDVHELINFFVIEAQRIVFAENVYASGAVATLAFLSYYLVNIIPYWGLALIAVTSLFLAPLIYTTNQELIDNTLHQASEIVGSQTAQIRSVASQQTAHVTEISKQYMGDYTSKAQELLRGRSASPEIASKAPATHKVHDTDFPTAPKAGLNDFSTAPKTGLNDFPTAPKSGLNDFPTAPKTGLNDFPVAPQAHLGASEPLIVSEPVIKREGEAPFHREDPVVSI